MQGIIYDPSLKVIELSAEAFIQKTAFKSFLTDLYLGPATSYTIKFDRQHLISVHKVFDEIILTNGIRHVSFSFVFDSIELKNEA